MDYSQAELDIVSRLAPFKTLGVQVELTPQAQADFKRPFTKGRIIVGYKGSKWHDPKSTAEMSQDEEVMFQIDFQSRTLREDIGIYKMLGIATQGLVGFAPSNCDRMYCKESGYTPLNAIYEDGVWTFSMIMACRSVSVEDFEEDLSVIIKKFTNIGEPSEGPAETFETPNNVTTPQFVESQT